jgi:hypothetical protein
VRSGAPSLHAGHEADAHPQEDDARLESIAHPAAWAGVRIQQHIGIEELATLDGRQALCVEQLAPVASEAQGDVDDRSHEAKGQRQNGDGQ